MWGNNGNSERLYFWGGSKITAGSDCSHEIKRHLLLGRKAMTNLDSILKSRDLTLPTKIHLVKAMVFPVATYGCESWTIKKAEHQRTDAFELWRWKRLLRVPWTARRSDQSILKEISPEYSLEGLMLKLKLQYFGHLMWRTDSLEKSWCWERLKAGGEGDDRGWDGWTDLMDMSFEQALGAGDGQGSLACYSPWGQKESDMTEWLNWTSNGRKWRGTKESLDEGEGRKGIIWLKTQHSKNEDHGIQSHHFIANRWRNSVNRDRSYLLGLQNHCRQWLQPQN